MRSYALVNECDVAFVLTAAADTVVARGTLVDTLSLGAVAAIVAVETSDGVVSAAAVLNAGSLRVRSDATRGTAVVKSLI